MNEESERKEQKERNRMSAQRSRHRKRVESDSLRQESNKVSVACASKKFFAANSIENVIKSTVHLTLELCLFMLLLPIKMIQTMRLELSEELLQIVSVCH